MTVVVAFIAALMVLRELAIDVLPLLTGAGIAGLAVGFGAQNLVRDVISGFFVILEDQIRVGDLARINDVQGVVEQINLRTIVLRDADAAVHVFPNGLVTKLANLSKDFSYAVVDVPVPYAESLERVRQTLEEIGKAMQQDPTVAPDLLGPVEVLGPEGMSPANVTMRARFRTRPLGQGEVTRALRRYILTEFSARGIRPFGGRREG